MNWVLSHKDTVASAALVLALVTLKYFEGLKYREISVETGLSISNVGYRLHHILRELAGKLRPLGIDEKS